MDNFVKQDNEVSEADEKTVKRDNGFSDGRVYCPNFVIGDHEVPPSLGPVQRLVDTPPNARFTIAGTDSRGRGNLKTSPGVSMGSSESTIRVE